MSVLQHPNISMIRLLVLVALASLCSAGGGGYKGAMMKKYAHYKVMEGCFGREEMMKYKNMMKDASEKCSKGDVKHGASHEFDFQEIINEIRSAALQAGSGSPSNQYYKLVPVLQGGRYRRDSHNHSSAEKLQYVKEKMTHRIANLTCMFRELNLINEDNTPNYPLLEIYVNEVGDPYLKDQLMHGFDMCKDYANCMPVKKAKNPMMKELGTFLTFISCYEMKKVMACFKKDFRYMMADYGYDAVEENINMALEMIGEEQEAEGMEGYNALEEALMGKIM
ncbi:unnamed protein product [Meganyctiphanes norvegica]|uniref:Uncharacterized protein n=1 Tax=Meganyctiphanes norvegica TaxID=48144 RepID=A0AAV2PQ94_MEGNR